MDILDYLKYEHVISRIRLGAWTRDSHTVFVTIYITASMHDIADPRAEWVAEVILCSISARTLPQSDFIEAFSLDVFDPVAYGFDEKLKYAIEEAMSHLANIL